VTPYRYTAAVPIAEHERLVRAARNRATLDSIYAIHRAEKRAREAARLAVHAFFLGCIVGAAALAMALGGPI